MMTTTTSNCNNVAASQNSDFSKDFSKSRFELSFHWSAKVRIFRFAVRIGNGEEDDVVFRRRDEFRQPAVEHHDASVEDEDRDRRLDGHYRLSRIQPVRKGIGLEVMVARDHFLRSAASGIDCLVGEIRESFCRFFEIVALCDENSLGRWMVNVVGNFFVPSNGEVGSLSEETVRGTESAGGGGGSGNRTARTCGLLVMLLAEVIDCG